jgi:hypothetical protein
MASIAKSFKTSDVELAKWQACAETAGLSFNAWLRRACNRSAELELALHRQEERERADRSSSDKDRTRT